MSSPLSQSQSWVFRNWFWAPNSSGSGGGDGGTSSAAPIAVQGVNALRNITPSAPYESYWLLYLNASNDGAGGQFVFFPEDTNSDDGIDYVIPNSITRPAKGSFVRV